MPGSRITAADPRLRAGNRFVSFVSLRRDTYRARTTGHHDEEGR
jgi:hypothetical protein